uniref:Serine protease 45 n=1 Tax=Lygus hesperus TaxID=30085 RepID=A0A0A9Y9U8_LYGHE
MGHVVLGFLMIVYVSVSSGLSIRVEELRMADSNSRRANITEAPYTIALAVQIAGLNEQVICTGAIIDPEWVLTAAHCIERPARGITAIAGADHKNQFSDAGVQKRTGKEVFTHPSYWKDRVAKYDVALLRVDKFEFNDRVNKVNLWGKPWVMAEPKAKHEYGLLECRGYGWGILEINLPGDSMRTVTLKAGHGTKACPCFKMYHQRRLVCSTERAGFLCKGDSGGPLVCENNTLVGVAHVIYNRKSCSPSFFGKMTLKCNSPDTVSMWMYVCPMLDFIHEHVPSAPEQPGSCLSSALSPAVLLSSLCLVIVFVSN